MAIRPSSLVAASPRPYNTPSRSQTMKKYEGRPGDKPRERRRWRRTVPPVIEKVLVEIQKGRMTCAYLADESARGAGLLFENDCPKLKVGKKISVRYKQRLTLAEVRHLSVEGDKIRVGVRWLE
jgi:hypothetical protein